MLLTILIVILILMLDRRAASWPYARDWGPWPAGGLGLVVLISC
jgi:hypothetical protein